MSQTVKLQCCITADFHVRKVKVHNLGELKVLVSQWFPTTTPEKLIFDYVDEDGDEVRVDSETEWSELAASMNPVRVRVRPVGVDFGVPLPLPVAGNTMSNFDLSRAAFANTSGNFHNNNNNNNTAASSGNVSPSANNNSNSNSASATTLDDKEAAAIAEKNRQVNERCPADTSTKISEAPCRAEDPAPKAPEEQPPVKLEEETKKEEVEKKEEKNVEEKKKEEQQPTSVEVGPSLPPTKNDEENEKPTNNTSSSTPAPAAVSSETTNNNNQRFLSPNLRPAYKEALTLLSNLYKVNAAESITKMSGGVFRGAIRIQANLASGEVKFEINDPVLHEHAALRIQELLNMNDVGSASVIAGDFVRLYPQSSSGHYNYAMVLCKSEQHDTAIAELVHAINLGVDPAAARNDPDFTPLNKFIAFRTLGLEDNETLRKALVPMMEMFPEMKLEQGQRLMKKHKNDVEAAANEYLGEGGNTNTNNNNGWGGRLGGLFGGGGHLRGGGGAERQRAERSAGQ